MATVNLSDYDINKVPSAQGMIFGLVVSEWNNEITGALLDGAYNTLIKHGANDKDIIIQMVPGSFELMAGGVLMAENTNVDAIICIGCIIRGETPHFDYICQGVTQGITNLNIRYKKPFIFGVLTTDNLKQAKDRAGGKHGNKGDEAAITAIKMVAIKNDIQKKK